MNPVLRTISLEGLELDNVKFAYPAGAPVFDGVSMTLPTDRAVWVTSRLHRGRSTLLKLLAGLVSAQSGRYLINGQNVSEMSFEEFLPYRLAMGYGFEIGGLINNKSLFDNLLLPLEYHKRRPRREQIQSVKDVVTRFELNEAAHLRPFAVSGSQRKLACLLRAFVHDPQIVFLDEPCVGLKQEHVEELLKYIRDGFQRRGLKQVYFTGEARFLLNVQAGRELIIDATDFHTRAVA